MMILCIKEGKGKASVDPLACATDLMDVKIKDPKSICFPIPIFHKSVGLFPISPRSCVMKETTWTLEHT